MTRSVLGIQRCGRKDTEGAVASTSSGTSYGTTSDLFQGASTTALRSRMDRQLIAQDLTGS